MNCHEKNDFIDHNSTWLEDRFEKKKNDDNIHPRLKTTCFRFGFPASKISKYLPHEQLP